MGNPLKHISDSLKRMMNSSSEKKTPEEKVCPETAQVIYRFQDSPILTEIDLSYLRPLKREKVLEKFDNFNYRDELSAVSCDDALILPGYQKKGGVIDSSGRLVKSSVSYWFGGAYDVEDSQIIGYDRRTVVFLGEYAASTWGHAIVSLMVRFWYCLSQNESADAYVIISEFPGQKQNSKPLNDLIRLAGLDKKVIFTDHPTRFKRVIVPEPSFSPGRYSDQFLKTIDTIRQNALKEASDNMDNMEIPEKVFLSRSRFAKAKRAEGGLKLLDHYFKKNGFTILYPEKLSLAQMVRIMQGAKVCASESGSITFNALFGNEDLHIIIIERIPLFPAGNMAAILSRAGRITYVDGCCLVWPCDVGGACMLGFTNEFEKFTSDYRYQNPSPKYLSTDFKKKCFKVYRRRYEKKNMYGRWLNSGKDGWLPVLYEAFLDSINQFPWLDRKAIIDIYYRDIPKK